MEEFFAKPFEQQVKLLIKSGDLKLLQAFVGIRNPIGLYQYYSSFLTTKINILEATLNGEYRVLERCLSWFKENAFPLECEETEDFSQILNWVPTFRDVSIEVKNNLLSTALIPKSGGFRDSLCNTKYMFPLTSENREESLINYVQNSEISSLCAIDNEQLIEIYKTSLKKSEFFLKEVIERFPFRSELQKKDIMEELCVIQSRIEQQEREIIQYKNSLREMQDRSFFRDWYRELLKAVKDDIHKKNHILNKYFPKDIKRSVVFMSKFQELFVLQITHYLLKEVICNKCVTKDLCTQLKHIINDAFLDIDKINYESVAERIHLQIADEMKNSDDVKKSMFKLVVREITPQKIMKAEQAVLDDMLLEAVVQDEHDCALLLICNGADINLERNVNKIKINVKEKLYKALEKSAFLVIRNLYKNMPHVKAIMKLNLDLQMLEGFAVEGSQSLKEGTKEVKVDDVLQLSDIRDSFPEDTAIKRAADSLVEFENDKFVLYEKVMDRENFFNEMRELYCKKVEEYTQPSWKYIGILPGIVLSFFSLPLAAVYAGFLSAYFAVDILIPWQAQKNAKNELEVAQADLYKAIKMFDCFLEYLQSTVVAGNDIFLERCNEIRAEIESIKRNNDKWVNVTKVILAFESALAVSGNGNCFNVKSVKFNKLAENIILNKKIFMDELGQLNFPNISSLNINTADQIREEIKKVEEAAEVERKAKEKAEKKTEEYIKLLLRVQNEEIPLSMLQNMDLEF